MFVSCARAARTARPFGSVSATRMMVLALCALFPASWAAADEIVRIEEDWELVVADPDPSSFAPQVTCTFSPQGDLSGYYGVFDLNLRNTPIYEAGGMQLQVWVGEYPVMTKKSNVGTLLNTANETVTWTTSMWISEGQLNFAITDGQSSTWGGFGSNGSLTVTVGQQLENLQGYSANVSIANSGIGFAANRVTSLTLKEVRAYSESKLEAVDSTDRVVHPQ